MFGGRGKKGRRTQVQNRGAVWRTHDLKVRYSKCCYFVFKRYFTLAKDFIIIFRFFHRGNPGMHFNVVVVADPLGLGAAVCAFARVDWLRQCPHMPSWDTSGPRSESTMGHQHGTLPATACHSFHKPDKMVLGTPTGQPSPAWLHCRQTVCLLSKAST